MAVAEGHHAVPWRAARLAVFLADAAERLALVQAAAGVAAPGARALVLHVGASAASHRLVEGAAGGLRAAGLAVQAEAMPAGLPVAWALLARVRTYAPDLIVMGSRGLVGAPAVDAGSVSHEVLRHATCPILLVPEGVHPGSRRGPVVVGWDCSPAADRAVAVGGAVAAGAGAGLQVVQVGDGPQAAPGAPRLPEDSGWIVLDPDPDGVGATIDRVADALDARLVVVGSRRLSVLDTLRYGSVGHQLLAISERPVLVVL